MINEDKAGCIVATLAIIAIASLWGISLGWRWYQAGVQATVLSRQGIHLTQWEVFVGVKTPERVIHFREH